MDYFLCFGFPAILRTVRERPIIIIKISKLGVNKVVDPGVLVEVVLEEVVESVVLVGTVVVIDGGSVGLIVVRGSVVLLVEGGSVGVVVVGGFVEVIVDIGGIVVVEGSGSRRVNSNKIVEKSAVLIRANGIILVSGYPRAAYSMNVN